MRFKRPQYNSYYRPNFFGGFSFFPPVIKMLLLTNTAIWLGTEFFGNFRIGDLSLGYVIDGLFALRPLGQGFYIWQLFTYLFLHGGFAHIFFNMLALWMFGMELENVWGSKKFLTYYLICGVGAGLSNLLIAPLFTTTGPTIGASGAIYGVLLAYGILFPDRLIFIYFLVPIKAKYFVILYMMLEFISVGSMDGIAHFAHLGGAFVGFLYLVADGYDFFQRRNSWRETVGGSTAPGPRQQRRAINYEDISDAKVYDIHDYHSQKKEAGVTQKQIDDILDKISHGGYQSLSDEEKRILFEASKKLN
ncbi:MAG: rhomboid family intramembrane serine protease [Bacteroidota bacterium]|nr:rhomboid family intramembrane serine protease [Bacteroidota bacterium]